MSARKGDAVTAIVSHTPLTKAMRRPGKTHECKVWGPMVTGFSPYSHLLKTTDHCGARDWITFHVTDNGCLKVLRHHQAPPGIRSENELKG